MSSQLHHLTTLPESDSMMRPYWPKFLEDEKIFITRWIARISAWSISMRGIGLEKIQQNWPKLFLRIPPIVDLLKRVFKDVFVFHFITIIGGGNQTITGARSTRLSFGATLRPMQTLRVVNHFFNAIWERVFPPLYPPRHPQQNELFNLGQWARFIFENSSITLLRNRPHNNKKGCSQNLLKKFPF